MKYLELFPNGFDGSEIEKSKSWPYTAYDAVGGVVIFSRTKEGNYVVSVYAPQEVPEYKPNWIDLGLYLNGKKLLVADRNVGAKDINDPGMYFSYANITGVGLKKEEIYTPEEFVTYLNENLGGEETEESLSTLLQSYKDLYLIDFDKLTHRVDNYEFTQDFYFTTPGGLFVQNNLGVDISDENRSLYDVAYVASNGECLLPTGLEYAAIMGTVKDIDTKEGLLDCELELTDGTSIPLYYDSDLLYAWWPGLVAEADNRTYNKTSVKTIRFIRDKGTENEVVLQIPVRFATNFSAAGGGLTSGLLSTTQSIDNLGLQQKYSCPFYFYSFVGNSGMEVALACIDLNCEYGLNARGIKWVDA